MFDHEPDPLGLHDLPPGPALAALLSTIDLDRLSGYDRVTVLKCHQRMASHYQAQVYSAMDSVADHMERVEFAADPELAWQAAATEIRAALHLTRRAADAALDVATATRRRLPRVWAALAAGYVDPRRARVFVDATSHLDVDTARRVVDEVIDDADHLTTGQLHARLRRLCMEVDSDTAHKRYTEATDGRRIVLESSPDGSAHLMALDLAPHRAQEAARRIHQIAMTLKTKDETRTIDQLRADVFIDLLTGDHQGAARGMIELTVDLATLAELSDAPGDLAGFGPVIADIARQVAEARTNDAWRFTISHPVTGLAVHDGTTARRPTRAQRRSVEARDRQCIFPGCRMPATQCDLDHRTPWSHDPTTSTDGLDALCKHDHVTVRHAIGWTRRPLPGGDHLWTSPLGHRYTTSGRSP